MGLERAGNLRQWLTSPRNRAWLIVFGVMLFSFIIRFHLRPMALERDEGEYAYAGQLLLQGVPPYRIAYNMKLPGTYAAYALIMALFGQTSSAIHLGLALVNAVSIALMFAVASKLLDRLGAVTATALFTLTSLSPAVLGLAGHATHFVVIAALAGLLLLLHGIPSRNSKWLFLSGIGFGLAFLMKQHGILFGIFGLVYLWWTRAREATVNSRPRELSGGSRSRQRRPAWWLRLDWLGLGRETTWFAGGLILPYALTCLVLWRAGIFSQFVFWTLTYAREYVSAIPPAKAPESLRIALGHILSGNPCFWILAAAGAFFIWVDNRVSVERLFLTGLALFSAAAVVPGFYFRPHYFILVLPALALLGGAAVSRGIHLCKHIRSLETFLAVPVLILFILGVGLSFVESGMIWFALSPSEASARIYGSSLFTDCASAAEFIKTHAAPDARIAVLGSEPQIYFYSHRRSATGYIYMYPLMEAHDYASRMQEEMIREIETAQPQYLVFVKDGYSWLPAAGSDKKVFTWWEGYWAAHYEMERTIHVSSLARRDLEADLISRQDVLGSKDFAHGSYLLILKRKSG